MRANIYLAFYDSWRTTDVAACLEGLAVANVVRGDYSAAVLVFGLADRLRTTSDILVPPADQFEHEHYLSLAQFHLDTMQFSEAWAVGHAMPLEAMRQFLPMR